MMKGWRWIVGLFSSQYEPIDRPPPLTHHCGETLDSPSLDSARTIQHEADNVLTGFRVRKQIEERQAQRAASDLARQVAAIEIEARRRLHDIEDRP